MYNSVRAVAVIVHSVRAVAVIVHVVMCFGYRGCCESETLPAVIVLNNDVL